MTPPHLAAQRREWEKDVVADPERQRHVPARPKDRGARGGKGTVEVFGHGDPQCLCRADSDVAIAREVEEELQSIAEGETTDVGPGPLLCAVESTDDSISCQNPLA